ncbi:S1 RNA-binding domain-containing protein [Patescibacteria group bacterium]|nr:S1 RNA-binding domain-containing protein [Patescibacteria group bacterium]
MAKIKKIKSFSELLRDKKADLIFRRGDEVSGRIISSSKNKILIDLKGRALGIVVGRELLNAPSNLKTGEKIKASVYDVEDEEGNVVLSFRARREDGKLGSFDSSFEKGKVIIVKVIEANRGGLLVAVGKTCGFLPVSQLSPKHYPRVEGGDKEKILSKLKEFIGEELGVKIININQGNKDIIFSERAAKLETDKEKLSSIKVADKVSGEISGVVDFGLFIHFDDLEGLIHISEVSWDRVEDIHRDFHVGDKVKAKVIEISEGRISLSIKQTQKDPWLKKIKKYKIGEKIQGRIKRLTPFGAFVELGNGLEGLIHISEISNERISDPADILKLADEIKAEIISLEPEEHKIGLSIKGLALKKKKKASPSADLKDIKLSQMTIKKLKRAGLDSLKKIAKAKVSDLKKIEGIGEAKAKKILSLAKKAK